MVWGEGGSGGGCGKGYVVVEGVSSQKIRYMKVRVRKQTDNKNRIRLKTEQKGDQ